MPVVTRERACYVEVARLCDPLPREACRAPSLYVPLGEMHGDDATYRQVLICASFPWVLKSLLFFPHTISFVFMKFYYIFNFYRMLS